MVSLVLPKSNTECMNIFLAEVSKRYPNDYILMVCDNAPWHKSQGLNIPENIELYPLLPYTPELNPIEMIWDELREKFFRNDFFKTLSAVMDRLCEGLVYLEMNQEIVKSITGWNWIVSMFAKENYYENWPKHREVIIEMFSKEVYGYSPAPPTDVHGEPFTDAVRIWGGNVLHQRITIQFTTPKGPFSFPIDLLTPEKRENLPLIIYISFHEYPQECQLSLKYLPVDDIISNGYAVAVSIWCGVQDERFAAAIWFKRAG